jgi:hypothetical protein
LDFVIGKSPLMPNQYSLYLCPLALNTEVWPGFFIPVPWTEPASSGTGIPVRFDRKPEEFKSQFKILVQSVQIGIPTGTTGIPVRFDWKPVVEPKKNRISGEFDVFSNLK